MSTLFPRTIQAEHRTGSYVRGDWVVSTVENFTFTGSVQPLTGKETEFLPENRRDTGLVKIYSNTPLAVSLEGSNTAGDVVIWAGKRWELIQELVYANGLVEHYKYIAAYIGLQETQNSAPGTPAQQGDA